MIITDQRLQTFLATAEGSSNKKMERKTIVNPLNLYIQTATHYQNILPTITAFCDLDADIKYIVMIIVIYRHHKKALRKIL